MKKQQRKGTQNLIIILVITINKKLILIIQIEEKVDFTYTNLEAIIIHNIVISYEPHLIDLLNLLDIQHSHTSRFLLILT